MQLQGLLTLTASTVSGNSTVGDPKGGGIYAYSGAISLTNSTVSGNSTTGDYAAGGGIYTYSGSVTLASSTVSGNSTAGLGASGGGLAAESGFVTLTNSTVSNNSTAGDYATGGGIAASSGDVALTGSTVSGNNTAGFGAHGGGIFTDSGAVTLTDSTVSDNSIAGAEAYGGGMYTYSGTLTLTGSTISGNNASGSSEADGGGIFNDSGVTRLTSSTVSNNRSSGDGGGIGTRYGSVALTSSTVSGNSTTGAGHGGGIYTASGRYAYVAPGRVSLTNSTVSGNRSGGHGGGIASGGDPIWRESFSNSLVIHLTSSTVSDNEAAGLGGGVYVFNHIRNPRITLENSIIAGNLDQKSPANSGMPSDLIPDPQSTLTSNYSLIGVADGLTLTGTDNLTGTAAVPLDAGLAPLGEYGGPTQTHALLPDSPAIDRGNDAEALAAGLATDQRGLLRSYDAGDVGPAGMLTDIGAYEFITEIVVDSTADLVDGDYSAGELTLREALALAATAPGEETITFDGSVFTGGDASRIRLTQGELEITETLTIDGSTGTEIVISGDAAGDDSLVAGTLITDVAASAAANQLNDNTRVFNFSSPTGDLTLEGLTITGGRTTVYGVDGAGICFGSDGLLTLTASTVSGNSTAGDPKGGGIYAYSGAISLTNSTVSGNSTTGDYAAGGGIYTYSGSVTLASSTVSGNSTAGLGASGGGLAAESGFVTLTNSTVSNNSTAGDYATGGGIAASSGDVALTGSTVSGNDTTGFGAHGGGIFTDSGAVTLTDSTVSDNSTAGAEAYGGGMYTYSGTMALTDSTVTGNRTTGDIAADGGGIFNDSGATSLTSSTISDNRSSGDGGGMGTRYGSVTLTGSTVSGNRTTGTGHGGGIYTASGRHAYVGPGRVSLTNSTVSGNSSGGHGGGIASGGDVSWQEDNSDSLVIELVSSTISDNQSAGAGGGIYVFDHAMNTRSTFENSIIAGNFDHKSPDNDGTPNDLVPDPDSTLASNYSLIGVADGLTITGDGNLTGTVAVPLDAGLYPLGDYGGPTETYVLLPDSLAIDAGDPSILFDSGAFDQRGAAYYRVVSDRMDIGAVEAAPIVVNPQTFHVDENSPRKTVVGAVDVSGPGATFRIAYAITSGNEDGIFAIDAETGIIEIADNTMLDYEVETSHILTMGVTDMAGLTSSAPITIHVNNLNESPRLSSASFSIDENAPNTTLIGNVASNPDDPDNVPTATQVIDYEIISGDSNGVFAIDPSTGDITVARSNLLNYEARSSYVLTVRATDNGSPALSTDAAISINLNDLNEPPQISDYVFEVDENSFNGTVVGKATVAFLDIGQVAEYEIVPDSESVPGVFRIDPETGEVIVINREQLDFEDGPSSYTFMIEVDEQGDAPGTSATALITITERDVNEAPLLHPATFEIAENSSHGDLLTQLAGSTPLASDFDAGDSLRYAITAGNVGPFGADVFAIDPQSGALSVNASSELNYELQSSYNLVVGVTDSGLLRDSKVFTVNVLDVNEKPNLKDHTFEIGEDGLDGSLVGVLQAEDVDDGQVLTYSITSGNGNWQEAFQIESTTGEIRVADTSVLDTSLFSQYILTVQAQDSGLPVESEIATVTIDVLEGTAEFTLMATVRDFHSYNWTPGTGATTEPHPDFQSYSGRKRTPGLVLDNLGLDGKPVFNPSPPALPYDEQLTGEEWFKHWFNDAPAYNRRVALPMRFRQSATDPTLYHFYTDPADDTTPDHIYTTEEFFPIDGRLFNDSTTAGGDFEEALPGEDGNNHNFGFTLELHAQFTYRPGQTFELTEADDDLWIFINGKLAIDLGGLHHPDQETLVLDAAKAAELGLEPGGTYPFDVFFAERHTDASHLVVQTTIEDFRPAGTDLYLQENTRFVSTIEDALPSGDRIIFAVPDNAQAISFTYEDLNFDTDDPAAINDAWELALVDQNGQSVVPTICVDKDAFFNFTEGEQPVFAEGAAMVGASTVVVDISNVPVGLEIELVTRLVNNDGLTDGVNDTSDTATEVRLPNNNIRFLDEFPAEVSGPEDVPASPALPPAPLVADFDALSNLSAGFDIDYGITSFNNAEDVLFTIVALTNNGKYEVRGDTGPLLVGVKNLSQPFVELVDPDGFTPDGMAYYDISRSAFTQSDQRLVSGDVVSGFELQFSNPNHVQFDYDLVVFGALNRAPEFITEPVTEVHFSNPNGYVYDALAEDLDKDQVDYELVSGPMGLNVDRNLGQVTWSRAEIIAAGGVGTYAVSMIAKDPDAAISPLHEFNISVVDVPNRPPRFTSTPVVDAYAGTPYVYQSTAVDADGDELFFENFGALNPEWDFSVHPVSGEVTWTPPESAIGDIVPITLRVEDRVDGDPDQLFGEQNYNIFVHPNPLNHDPIIVSEPSLFHRLPGATTPFFDTPPHEASSDVNAPDGDLQAIQIPRLDPGEVYTETVSITVPVGTPNEAQAADVIFVVDESYSMGQEHDWLADVATALDANLMDSGIGDGDLGNQFGLVGFGGAYGHFLPHGHAVDEDDDPLLGSAADFVAATQSLTLSGGTEDGWAGIEYALSTYNFRDGAATNIILVTDEDRDNTDYYTGYQLTYQSLLNSLTDVNAILNVVVDAAYEDSEGTEALGVNADGDVFLSDGSGGYVLSSGHELRYAYGTTVEEYVELAWETQGATWDLNRLRHSNSENMLGQSFTQAFIDVKTEEIVSQLGIEVVASPDSPIFTNLTGIQASAQEDGLAEFDIQIVGDGQPYAFDLQFMQAGGGNVIGSIPVGSSKK